MKINIDIGESYVILLIETMRLRISDGLAVLEVREHAA
jgi:hypothetical protein